VARNHFDDHLQQAGQNVGGPLTYVMQRPQLGPNPISSGMSMGGGVMIGGGPGMMYSMPNKPGGLPPPGGMGGKVYPANQPMVFNPSNPNAPPIYPCSVCHKEVHDNDQAILCESGCNFWFHRMCTGLTEAAYHMLTKEVYAEWVCDTCLAVKSIPLVKMKP